MNNRLIQPAALREFHHEEVFNYTQLVAHTFQTQPLGDLATLFDRYTTALADYQAKLEPVRTTITPRTMVEKDQQRTQTFRALRQQIKGYLYSTDDQELIAAADIQDVIHKYNTIPTQNYRKKSASIYNFLEELNTNYAQQITTLRLQTRLQMLHDQNQQFNTYFYARNTENRRLATSQQVKESRRTLIAHYRTLINSFEVLAQTHHYPADPQTIAQPINEALERWNIVLAKRRTLNKKKQTAKKTKQQPQ